MILNFGVWAINILVPLVPLYYYFWMSTCAPCYFLLFSLFVVTKMHIVDSVPFMWNQACLSLGFCNVVLGNRHRGTSPQQEHPPRHELPVPYCKDRPVWCRCFPCPWCLSLLACLPDAGPQCKGWLPGRGWQQGWIWPGLRCWSRWLEGLSLCSHACQGSMISVTLLCHQQSRFSSRKFVYKLGSLA